MALSQIPICRPPQSTPLGNGPINMKDAPCALTNEIILFDFCDYQFLRNVRSNCNYLAKSKIRPKRYAISCNRFLSSRAYFFYDFSFGVMGDFVFNIRSGLWTDRFLQTGIRNANQWYPITSWLEGSKAPPPIYFDIDIYEYTYQWFWKRFLCV